MFVAKDNLLHIARVLKSNGTDGEILVSLVLPAEEIRTEEPVYLIFDELPVPFFITSIRARGKKRAIVSLEGVNNFEDSEEILGKEIYVDKESYEELAEDEQGLAFLNGWILYDSEGYRVGTIIGTLEIPGNPCLEVRLDEGEEDGIYIPFNEDLIIALDQDNKEIQMEIAEGLID